MPVRPGIVATMAKNRGKTGGTTGTNQYGVIGASKRRDDAGGSRGAALAAANVATDVEPKASTHKSTLSIDSDSVCESSLTVAERDEMVRPMHLRTTMEQIGKANWTGMTGGRVDWVPAGDNGAFDEPGASLLMPIDDGYAVEVFLAWNDTYTVRRTRNGETVGEVDDVYGEELARVTYDASCYKNVDFGPEAVTPEGAITMPLHELVAQGYVFDSGFQALPDGDEWDVYSDRREHIGRVVESSPGKFVATEGGAEFTSPQAAARFVVNGRSAYNSQTFADGGYVTERGETRAGGTAWKVQSVDGGDLGWLDDDPESETGEFRVTPPGESHNSSGGYTVHSLRDGYEALIRWDETGSFED